MEGSVFYMRAKFRSLQHTRRALNRFKLLNLVHFRFSGENLCTSSGRLVRKWYAGVPPALECGGLPLLSVSRLIRSSHLSLPDRGLPKPGKNGYLLRAPELAFPATDSS